MCFPAYWKSKYISIKLDIIGLWNNAEEPLFDFILRVETLASIGVVLYFGTRSIIIEHMSNLMQHYEAFKYISKLYQIAKGEQLCPWRKLEPISAREITKRAVTILDTKYKNADPRAIVSGNYDHLDSLHHTKLVALLEKNEELYDGTLEDFQIYPVRFNLQ